MRRRATRRGGFSLIEALVALAIAALAFTAIFELQAQMTLGQMRLQRTLDSAAIQLNALELVRDVNPMEEPFGERSLSSGQIVSWTSIAVTEPRRNAGFPAGDGAFDVALFDVDVAIQTQGGRELGALSFRRLGWRRSYAFDASL